MNKLDYQQGFDIDLVKLDSITRNSPITRELLIKHWEDRQELKLLWESLYPRNVFGSKAYLKTLIFPKII